KFSTTWLASGCSVSPTICLTFPWCKSIHGLNFNGLRLSPAGAAQAKEIAQQLHAVRPAFFRMKLHAVNVIAAYNGGHRLIIIDGGQHILGSFRFDVEGMDKVGVSLVQPLKNGIVAL